MSHGKHGPNRSENRGGFYREVFQTINDAVFVHLVEKDGFPGPFVEVNDVACQRLGYSRDELLGMTPADIADPHRDSHLALFRDHLMAHGNTQFETVHVAKDGSLIPVESNVRLFDHNGHQAALSISRVITERKQIEEERQAALQRLQHIVEFLPDATFVVDRDQRVIAWNRAIEEMTGVCQEAMIGKDRHRYTASLYGRPGRLLIDRIHDADERIAKDYDFVRRENGRLMGEVYLPSIYAGRGGHVLASAAQLFDESGTVIGAIETIRDITERKAAEKALAESEGQKNLILNATAEMVTYFDPGLRVIWANHAAGASVGQSPEELVGRRCHEIWNQSPTPCPDCPVLQAGKTRTPQEGQRQTPDGRHWALRGYPVFNEAGDVVALVEFGQDITERKQAEAERARLKDQFHRAQRLDSVGRLAGGVAHDLNNLLSPILGYGEMLLEDTDRSDADRESLEEIVKAGVRARDLVRQLLAFSRKQTMAFKAVDLNRLLKDFKKLLRRTIREDIIIRWILPKTLPSIQGDAGQLDQVLMNLAVNAQDAMPHGGELTVETAAVDLDASQAHGLDGIDPGAYVVLTLSDTGTGMSPDTQKRLFDPFFTTKGPDKGTGLGLATVYGIVKQHGGNVWVDSEPGAGSTFRVYLPVAEKDESEAAQEKGSAVGAGGRETILLVEDNEQVRKLALTILKRRGYTVLAAANGKEALALATRHEAPLHLLLTDVVMPGMNGKQLYEQLMREHPDVKVLYMSGYTDAVIAQRGLAEKGIQYIQKPFSIKALSAKVREVLNC